MSTGTLLCSTMWSDLGFLDHLHKMLFSTTNEKTSKSATMNLESNSEEMSIQLCASHWVVKWLCVYLVFLYESEISFSKFSKSEVHSWRKDQPALKHEQRVPDILQAICLTHSTLWYKTLRQLKWWDCRLAYILLKQVNKEQADHKQVALYSADSKTRHSPWLLPRWMKSPQGKGELR